MLETDESLLDKVFSYRVVPVAAGEDASDQYLHRVGRAGRFGTKVWRPSHTYIIIQEVKLTPFFPASLSFLGPGHQLHLIAGGCRAPG